MWGGSDNAADAKMSRARLIKNQNQRLASHPFKRFASSERCSTPRRSASRSAQHQNRTPYLCNVAQFPVTIQPRHAGTATLGVTRHSGEAASILEQTLAASRDSNPSYADRDLALSARKRTSPPGNRSKAIILEMGRDVVGDRISHGISF